MAINRRIHIIGNCGSGKSYLAKKIGHQLNIPVTDLDQVFWNNDAKQHGTIRPQIERDKMLENVLSKSEWILEGIYYTWLQKSFEQADIIIIIQPNEFIRNYYLIIRFLKQKLGIIRSKKDSFKSFLALMSWANKYSSEKMPALIETTQPYHEKRYFFKTADQAFEFLVSGIK